MSDEQHTDGGELPAEAEQAIQAILEGEDMSLQPDDHLDLPTTGKQASAEGEDQEEGEGEDAEAEASASEEGQEDEAEGQGEEDAAAKGDKPQKTFSRAEYLAAVGRKDQQLRQAQAEMRELKQRLEQADEAPKGGIDPDKLRSDPYGALQSAGVDLRQFLTDIAEGRVGTGAQHQAAQGQQAQKPNSELEKIKEELAALKHEREQQQAQTVYESQLSNVRQYLSEREEYPLVSEFGLEEHVFKAINEHLGGQTVSGREAQELIDLYASQVEKAQADLLERAKSSERVRQKYLAGLQQSEPKPTRPAKQGTSRGKSPQMSNLASERTGAKGQDLTGLSEDQLIELAAADAEKAASMTG